MQNAGYPWLRLTLSDEKNPLISYDVHHIYETQQSQEIFEDAGQSSKPKSNYRSMNIMPVVPSSDEEGFISEDDDDFFCE
ncbi:uncharacterized protein LOC105275133 isoform X2 [Ooceraea biroi]|uniref:uncharacterized protein LOC105275133 isoform X2 n=1 Tax=Ooceraea biroi TaxID=2015173 RepID=UPI0009716E98|nr:uncharacterized protein LOC105275133 isoform X2 [Ooceraea biroi]